LRGQHRLGRELHAVPVSRFTRLQEALADTSNECSDFTQYPVQTKKYAVEQAHALQDRTRARLRPQPGKESAAVKSCAQSMK